MKLVQSVRDFFSDQPKTLQTNFNFVTGKQYKIGINLQLENVIDSVGFQLWYPKTIMSPVKVNNALKYDQGDLFAGKPVDMAVNEFTDYYYISKSLQTGQVSEAGNKTILKTYFQATNAGTGNIMLKTIKGLKYTTAAPGYTEIPMIYTGDYTVVFALAGLNYISITVEEVV